jgi:hypothetical protein
MPHRTLYYVHVASGVVFVYGDSVRVVLEARRPNKNCR